MGAWLVVVPFRWTLDFRLWTWIWDSGLGLGLDKEYVILTSPYLLKMSRERPRADKTAENLLTSFTLDMITALWRGLKIESWIVSRMS